MNQEYPSSFALLRGSTSDIAGLKELPCELLKGAMLFADKAYHSYKLEDDLQQMAAIKLVPRRKNNLTRQHSTLEFILRKTRNRIETVFSSILNRMPRYIRARTERGFYLKISFFIIVHLFSILSVS